MEFPQFTSVTLPNNSPLDDLGDMTWPTDPTLSGYESSSGYLDSMSSNYGTSPPHSSGDNHAQSSKALVKRKPIPRKGHTKSRLGCFNCKKRKIKCQETRPMCDNCKKAGMRCAYPKSTPEEISALSSSPINQPQSTPTSFSLTDMQFFHHFLTRAYPHLPVGEDKIWVVDMPKMAHQVRYQTAVECWLTKFSMNT